jgi:hypothetical protein
VDDHLRDQARDDPTLGMLLVVGRDDVTVEIALHGVSTPLTVTEWHRLPAEVRQALPAAEDFRATVAQTVHEIESTPPAVLRRSERRPTRAGVRLTGSPLHEFILGRLYRLAEPCDRPKFAAQVQRSNKSMAFQPL